MPHLLSIATIIEMLIFVEFLAKKVPSKKKKLTLKHLKQRQEKLKNITLEKKDDAFSNASGLKLHENVSIIFTIATICIIIVLYIRIYVQCLFTNLASCTCF